MIHTRRKVLNTVFVLTLTVTTWLLLFEQKDDSILPVIILASACSVYLIWALIFHHLDKSLTWPVFIEYVLTATLVLILLFGILV